MKKSMKQVHDFIEEMECEEVMVFSSPDYHTAFMGIDLINNRAIYDYDKMVEYLMEKDDIDGEEAIEFIDYNTIGAINPNDPAYPIIIYSME